LTTPFLPTAPMPQSVHQTTSEPPISGNMSGLEGRAYVPIWAGQLQLRSMREQGRTLIKSGVVALVVGLLAWFILWFLETPLLDVIYRLDDVLANVLVYGSSFSVFLLFLLPQVGLALIATGIAVQKGRSLWLWLLIGLVLGWIAVIIALLIRNDASSKVDQGLKKCPHCSEWVDRSATQCRFCLSELPTANTPPDDA